jgi:dynein heavy chain
VQVAFSFEVRDDIPANASQSARDGCYVTGLFLEGARWDESRKALGESRPKELFTSFPTVWLHPQQHHFKPASGVYDCPVYKTITRAGTLSTTGHSTNFVMDMEVPSHEVQSHWINRGVALFCSLPF